MIVFRTTLRQKLISKIEKLEGLLVEMNGEEMKVIENHLYERDKAFALNYTQVVFKDIWAKYGALLTTLREHKSILCLSPLAPHAQSASPSELSLPSQATPQDGHLET